MTRPAAVPPGVDVTNDPRLNEIWRRLDLIASVLNASFLSGQLLTEEIGARPRSGFAFGAGEERLIPHRLGRKATGFLELYGTDLPSAARVGLYSIPYTGDADSRKYLSLKSTSAGTCYLWVF